MLLFFGESTPQFVLHAEAHCAYVEKTTVLRAKAHLCFTFFGTTTMLHPRHRQKAKNIEEAKNNREK